MNREQLEEGKRLLFAMGPMKMVQAVSSPPTYSKEEVGTVLENKAQGNITYGYFEEDLDDEEQNALGLIVWLMNNASALIACADVALTANLEVPTIALNEGPAPEPHEVGVMMEAISRICMGRGLLPEKIANDRTFLPYVVQHMFSYGITNLRALEILTRCGYFK